MSLHQRGFIRGYTLPNGFACVRSDGRKRLAKTAALLVGFFLLLAGVAEAQAPVVVQIGSSLVWDAPAGTFEGFVLSCGTVSGTYPFKTFLPRTSTTAVITAGMVSIPGGPPPTSGIVYGCIVQAQNITGMGAASNEGSFVFPPVPGAVTNLRVVQ